MTCGAGRQSRIRNCNTPAHKYGGNECLGSNTEWQPCTSGYCPGMWMSINMYKPCNKWPWNGQIIFLNQFVAYTHNPFYNFHCHTCQLDACTMCVTYTTHQSCHWTTIKKGKTYILNLWHSFRVYTFGCYLCAYAAYYPELLWSMLHDVITGYTLYHWFTSRIFDDCLDEVT